MARGLAVFLFLCLSAQPVFAFSIDWQKRVQRFSQYVGKHAVAQGELARMLGMQSKSFNSRVQSYVRALEKRAR